MYQFQHEFQRKERIFKAYIFLFIITALVNVFLFLVDNNSSYPILRGSISLYFSVPLYTLACEGTFGPCLSLNLLSGCIYSY